MWQMNQDSSQQSQFDQLLNFDDSKYKNRYFMMTSAPGASPPVGRAAVGGAQPSVMDPQSPRFTDLLKMSSASKKYSKNKNGGGMFRTQEQMPGSRIAKGSAVAAETGAAGARDRSVRSRKSNKSGKSHGGNSHKSGAKRRKNNKVRAAAADGIRNSDVKVKAKGQSQLLLENNSVEIDSLEQENSFEKERVEYVSGKVPLSIEKYAVIENMKNLHCKGTIEPSGDADLRVQRQYRSSQQVLMQILESPSKYVENDSAGKIYMASNFDGENDLRTFQNQIGTAEKLQSSLQAVVSEHGSELKASVKTPFSKSKSIKEKTSLKSKKKRKSKQKSEKKNKWKDDQSIKSKKQQLKMFISTTFSNTQKMTKQIKDYQIQGDGNNEVEDELNQMQFMEEQLLPVNGPIEELETFREGYNDEMQMERSSGSFHDQMYESLIIKKPSETYPIQEEKINEEMLAQTMPKEMIQPMIERLQTEPCYRPGGQSSNMKYNNAKALQNYSEQKILKLNSRGETSNHDNSDFGSSEGTNIHLNFPAAIHELISPGHSNCTNTNLRSSAKQSSKNFRYTRKKDSLPEDSRNQTNFFMRAAKNQTANTKCYTQKSQEKKQLTATQKISFNHQKLDVSKSPYKRSYNCSIAEDLQVKSATSTPGKLAKQKLKKHRQSCFDDTNKTSPILRDHLRIIKDDSVSAPRIKVGPQTTTNIGKSKRYQTLRNSDFSAGHLSKSLTNHRHLQSTQIIKQMKQNAKDNGRVFSGIRKVNPNCVSSPTNALKNNSLYKKQMCKNDGDENGFDESSCKLGEQYTKVISVKERDMNNRTLSGPIVYQMNSEKEGQNQQSNDCLLRQINKDKKQLLKTESQPPSTKDYMKMGKQSQTPHQTVNQKSSKLLQNQQFHVQSTSSSTLLSTKTPNKAAINKLFNTQTDGVTVSNRLTQGPSCKNTNLFQSSHGSTSTEHDCKTSKVKALSLDRQCVQPLASLENIKEQDDEMDNKQDHIEDEQSSCSPNKEQYQPLFTAEQDDEDDEVPIHQVKKPVSFTERNTAQNKAPFDEELSQLENQMEKTTPLSPKEPNGNSSKSKMKEKQKSLHSLVTSKNMTNSQIEYTQRILNSSQMVQNTRSTWRNKRISYGNCLGQTSHHNTNGDDQLKLNPSKTYQFQKSQMSQQPASRYQVNNAYQNHKLIGNKSSGFCPPSLREMLKPKGANMQNISSIRSSKNTSAQNTAKVGKEPESALAKLKSKDIGQKKSDFIMQSYSNNNSGKKKGSGSKQQKSISKRELLSMSVLSEHRNANVSGAHGILLKDDANDPQSSQQKSERRAHNLLNQSIMHNTTRRKQDTTRAPAEKPQSLLDRKVSQDNLLRHKKQAMNLHKQKSTVERNKSPTKHQAERSLAEYRDVSTSQFQSTKRQKPAVSIGRQDRNKSNFKVFNQIMKDSRESQRQHYSNLYSKQGQQPASIGQKSVRIAAENQQVDTKESKEELVPDQQIQNGKQNNITERKLYYQLEQQKNSDSNKRSSVSLDKKTDRSDKEESNKNQEDSAKMNKHSKSKKGSTQFKRKQSLVNQSRGTPHQNVTLSKANIGEFDPYHGLSGRNSRDQQIRTPGQMQYLVTAGRNSLTKDLSKDMYSVQGLVNQTPSTAPAGSNNKITAHSERLIQKDSKVSKNSTGGELNDLEQSFEMQQQQNTNQFKSKKQQIQLQNQQNMDKPLIDQFIQINTTQSQSNRSKPQTSKHKAITQPITSNFSREPIFQSHLVSNDSVPTHLQERILKEAAVLNDHRGSQKQGSNFNNLYTHKMLSDNTLTSSAATYTSTTGGAMTTQIKSQMSKKAARADNTSVGPTSKFKSSAKASNLSSHGNNIKAVYGIGGGILASSNQNVQMRSQFQGGTQKMNSTSMVRQKTELAVNNSILGHQQKTPITQMQGHTPVALGHNYNMNAGGNQLAGAAGKEKKQSFAALLQPYEKEKFGDRCPLGFKKKGLLGKGGIAMVWLAEIREHKRYGYSEDMIGMRVALKQFPKIKGVPIDNSAKIEIETGNTLFPLEIKEGTDGERDEDFVRGYAVDEREHPGIRSIARLIDQIEDTKDVWLVYEVGAACLGKQLCDVKGEFYKGERIYRISHQDFYQILIYNNNVLRTLIVKIAEVFDVLSRFGIVHSDIKPDNILIELKEDNTDIKQIKLIDFGSAFQFHNVTQISATTPEYLAPEILNYLDDRNKNSKSVQTAMSLSQRSWPWSFDVWSLGIILLEIITGCPVWMSLKCRMQTVDGKSVIGSGLLGVPQRDQKKIIIKQQQILKNIPSVLRKFECYGLDRDPAFMDLLHQMLTPDPSKRISPVDIINHPFCTKRN